MQRGRPRHDDVLTPREWQVLALIRDGLTNEQIAERLEISLATAKFHVSEIMGKLGVESRQAAAAWPGRPKIAFGLAPLAWLRGRAGSASLPRPVGIAVLVAAMLGLLVLALGVVLMAGRDEIQPVVQPSTSAPAHGPVLETEVIAFRLQAIPSDRRDGDFCMKSGVLSREDAWRCGPGADPCFGEPGALEVICPLRPDIISPNAYIMELTQPLIHFTPMPGVTPSPDDLARERSQAWVVQTADGATCGIKASGTTGVVNGKPIRYFCDDGSGLVGLLTPGTVWTALQVPNPEDYFGPLPATPARLTTVELRTVWR